MTDVAQEETTEQLGSTGPAGVVYIGGPNDTRTVFERMVAIITELPAIGKDQRNTQQNFMFRGHDDVMNALNPLLAKHGVFIAPDVLQRITGERTTGGGKTMYEVNLHVRFRFYGASGDSFTASGWGEGTDMGDKSTSKAMTMAFKYVIAETFALATAEVSDADAGSPEETVRDSGAGERVQQETKERKRGKFDPAKHVLDGAIVVRTEEDADSLRRACVDFDPEQPWNDIEEFVVLHLFDKPYEELDGKQKREFYTRFANAVVKANQLAGPGDFPPPTMDQVAAAWAWAFNGITLVLDVPVEAVTDAEEQAVPAEQEGDGDA